MTLSLLVVVGHGAARTVTLTVKNPSEATRRDAIVTAPATVLDQRVAPGAWSATTTDGKALPVQLDDLDGDGLADELVAVVDLGPREAVGLRVDLESRWSGPSEVDVQLNWLGQDFAVLETDRIAYRIYEFYRPVDIPGGLQWDCYGKRPAAWGLSLDALAKVNYHVDNPVGVDFLKVGSSLGLGGVVLGDGRPVNNQTARYSHKVIASGPLRAGLQVDITDWKTPAGGLYQGAGRYFVYARREFIDARFTVVPQQARDERLGAGIVRHDTVMQELADQHLGVLAAWGQQEGVFGQSGLAVLFRPQDFHRFTALEGTINSRAVILEPSMVGRDRVEARVWLVGVWEHGGVATAVTFLGRVKELAAELNGAASVTPQTSAG